MSLFPGALIRFGFLLYIDSILNFKKKHVLSCAILCLFLLEWVDLPRFFTENTFLILQQGMR